MEKELKILIVDDDVELREMYGEIFHNAGFEVFQAEDGLKGLDMATKELPDVIFTGIVMPGMDGFTLMESLKKTVVTANIPVIISSHMGKEEDRRKASDMGAKDFIVRGTTRPIEVVERIRSLFSEPGGEYKIIFNPYDMDAQKLAKDLALQASFQCLDCREKLVMRLKLINPKDRVFEAQFVCPKCGWVAK